MIASVIVTAIVIVIVAAAATGSKTAGAPTVHRCSYYPKSEPKPQTCISSLADAPCTSYDKQSKPNDCLSTAQLAAKKKAEKHALGRFAKSMKKVASRNSSSSSSSAPSGGSSIYYQPGYPRVVSASQTPEEMSDYLRQAGIPTDIAVAPGVWVQNAPGATIDENVATGDLIGYCGSVQAFVDENPDLQSGSTCW